MPPKTYPTASTRRGVLTTGGIDFNKVRKFNRFLAHQWANVGKCRYQRCPILYRRRPVRRRLRSVSARVRSLVSNRLRRKFLLGSGTCLTYWRRLARWRWNSLVSRDPPTFSQSSCYPVSYPPWEGARYLGPPAPCWDSVVGVGRDCRKLSYNHEYQNL